MPNEETNRESLNAALKHLDDAADTIDLYRPEDDREIGESVAAQRRKGRRRVAGDNFGAISLVEEDGVLRWEEGFLTTGGPGRRARRAGATTSGEIVRQYKFEKLEANKVGDLLVNLDAKLTPNQGLRRVRLATGADGEQIVQLEKIDRPSAKKRALVIVHGTFSNTENLFSEIQQSKQGRAFLANIIDGAGTPYDEVLAFNHPTLSISPVMNAMDLSHLFADCPAQIDVICHSRGGLVTRWWLEGVARGSAKPGKVVAVASPLGGTSGAAPPRLRASLNFMTNIGRALETAGSVASVAAGLAGGAPFMIFAGGLVKVITSITGWASNLPLIDAAVAMIPGLAAQSRVNNNLELARLMRPTGQPTPEYFSVISSFKPEEVGWKFWKLFNNPAERALDLGAGLVFEQENDLVVDTRSMTELYKDGDTVLKRVEAVHDFGNRTNVYHTNYFRQPETIGFIRKSLGV